ncbi:MAG: serine protease [Syntrophus sp. (in: bacteria)]
MAKKSQPALVIWVGMMIVVMIGIGMAAFFARPAPTAQVQSQPAVSRGSAGILDNTYAAFFTRPRPMGQMQNQPVVNPGASSNNYSQLSDETNKITVSIYDGSNGPGRSQFLGSGVIVTSQEVLTNAHIVNNKNNLFVYVFSPQQIAYPVALSRCDSVNDLALLKVTNSATFSSVGLLGNPEELVVGDSVFAMGNAFGNGNLLSSGVLMDKNFKHPVNGQTRTSLRTNISISPGTCGGPLVNAKGEIIGISNSENDYFVTAVNRALPLIYNSPQSQVAATASGQFA